MKRVFVAAVLMICMAAFLLPGAARALDPEQPVSEDYAGSVYDARLRALERCGDWRSDLIAVALSQVGYHEGDCAAEYGGGSSTGWGNCMEYGSVYGGLNAEWCAMFVSWCARQAGIPRYVINTAARARSDGLGGSTQFNFHIFKEYKDNYVPRGGDLIFFSSVGGDPTHVGIVVKVTDTEVWTVEGNAMNAVRLCCYPQDSDYIVYYGNYLFDEGERSGEFCATRLEFVNSDGGFNHIPDDDERLYAFTALYAMHGREFTLPTEPYVREDCALLGFRVQRSDDARWYCADGVWRSPAELDETGAALYLMEKNSAYPVEGFLTAAETLRLYSVWTREGETLEDSAAQAALTPDGEGWYNPYCDVGTQHWYYGDIRRAAQAGLLDPAAYFRPERAATRGEFVTLLHRLFGKPAAEETAPPFSDISEGGPLWAAARWAYGSGAVTGTRPDAFQPELPLTREQAAVVLYRLRGGGAAGRLPAFGDETDISGWALPAVGWAAERGLLLGSPGAGGTLLLHPGAPVTRAQAVALACRVLARMETADGTGIGKV